MHKIWIKGHGQHFSQFHRKNPSSQNFWNMENLNAIPKRLWFHCAFWWCRLLHDSSTDFFVTISDKNNPQKKWGLSTSWKQDFSRSKKILLNTSPCRSVRFDAFFSPSHCTVNYDRNFRNVFKYYEAFFHYEIGFKTPIKAIFLVKIGKK